MVYIPFLDRLVAFLLSVADILLALPYLCALNGLVYMYLCARTHERTQHVSGASSIFTTTPSGAAAAAVRALFHKVHSSVYSILVIILIFYIAIHQSTVPAIEFPGWETLQDVDNDFYERNLYNYQPRPIQELVYSQGEWRVAQLNSQSSMDPNHCQEKDLEEQEQPIIRFRGINIPAKLPHSPTQLQSTQNSQDLYSTRHNVSFVGSPFPLNEAKEHFQRLSNYGYNIIRLTVTWEAVMHEGPGLVDNDYLAYLSSLIDEAALHGLYVLIDPHQDVWSRFTGGDGAPFWTLDAVGFETRTNALHETGCATLHQFFRKSQQEQVPKMIWPTNYGKLATATMFTLFFAGDVYAPNIFVDPKYYYGCWNSTNEQEEHSAQLVCKENGGPITMQSFLQQQYILFIDTVAKTVKDKTNVVGFNSMNEPSNGLIGVRDLRERSTPFLLGHMLSFFDGMRLGSGESIYSDYYHAPFQRHLQTLLNPDNKLAWKSIEHDVWKKVGIYDIDYNTGERILLRPDHFRFDGNFIEQYMTPFFSSIQTTINKHNKQFVTFAEPFIDLRKPLLHRAPKSLDADKFSWAPHWVRSINVTDIFLLLPS